MATFANPCIPACSCSHLLQSVHSRACKTVPASLPWPPTASMADVATGTPRRSTRVLPPLNHVAASMHTQLTHMGTSIQDITVNEVERARMYTSLLAARVFIVISISLNFLAWSSTTALLAAGSQAISTEPPLEAAPNASACARADEADDSSALYLYWGAFALQACLTVPLAYWVLWRFARCAERAHSSEARAAADGSNGQEQVEAKRGKAARFEAKFRSVAVSNVLSSLACVLVSSLQLAFVFTFPSSAAVLAASFTAVGAGSATLLDVSCSAGHRSPTSVPAAEQRCAGHRSPTSVPATEQRCAGHRSPASVPAAEQRWQRLTEVWLSGFAWSIAVSLHQAIEAAVYTVPLGLAPRPWHACAHHGAPPLHAGAPRPRAPPLACMRSPRRSTLACRCPSASRPCPRAPPQVVARAAAACSRFGCSRRRAWCSLWRASPQPRRNLGATSRRPRRNLGGISAPSPQPSRT